MATTSLGRTTGNDNFPQCVSRVLRESAELARASYGDSMFVDNHVHALGDLAALVDSVGVEDQRVRALFLIQGFCGGSTDTWTPGEQTSQLIASCGLGPTVPTAAESLAELVAVGIEDFHAIQQKRIQTGSTAGKRVEQLTASNEKMSKELKEAREKVENLDKQLTEQRAREAELVAQANHLRQALDAAASAKPKPTATKQKPKKKADDQPRRVRVLGEENEGIYTVSKMVAPGEFTTVYELGYKDGAGKQRWRRLDLGTDLDEARRIRAELHVTKEPAAA